MWLGRSPLFLSREEDKKPPCGGDGTNYSRPANGNPPIALLLLFFRVGNYNITLCMDKIICAYKKKVTIPTLSMLD